MCFLDSDVTMVAELAPEGGDVRAVAAVSSRMVLGDAATRSEGWV